MTTTTQTRTAKRWRCYATYPACLGASGAGRAPAKCPRCGSAPLEQDGIYGVFEWRGDGNYRLADALGSRLTERAADTLRAKLDPTDSRLVVRFVDAS